MTFLPVVSRQFWGVGLIFHPPAVPLALNNLQSILKIATSSCFQLFSFKPCLACHDFPLHFHSAWGHKMFCFVSKKINTQSPTQMCKSTELEFQNIWKRQVGAIVSQKLMGLQESFRKMLHQRLLRQNFPGYLCKALLCLKSTLSTINFSDGLFVFELEFENLANTFSERSLSKPMLWCICIKIWVFAEPFSVRVHCQYWCCLSWIICTHLSSCQCWRHHCQRRADLLVIKMMTMQQKNYCCCITFQTSQLFWSFCDNYLNII